MGDQRLEHVAPARSLPRRQKKRRPKGVEAELVPQEHRQPAGAPLSRTTQTHLAQSDRDDIAVENGRLAIFRKQRNLLRLRRVRVEDFDRLAPSGFLAVVDLAEVENLALRDAAVVEPAVFDHRPRSMLLAVLAANLVAQKHDAGLARLPLAHKGVGRHYKPFSTCRPHKNNTLRLKPRPKIAKSGPSWRSRANPTSPTGGVRAG